MTDAFPAAAEQLVARFWTAYDHGEFEAMASLLAPDARFRCRTDTGATDFEDFVRADLRGRDQIMRWQTEHRLGSPHPLRHVISNFHLVDRVGDLDGYRHYLIVAAVRDLKPDFVPGGVVEGSIRRDGDGLSIADISLTLDTMDSITFAERTHQEQP